jgi:Flp pilus assembly pilin Flp
MLKSYEILKRGTSMRNIKNFLNKFAKDESGQGTAEYVLLLAIVIALVAMFRNKIRTAFESQTNAVSSGISDFSGNE